LRQRRDWSVILRQWWLLRRTPPQPLSLPPLLCQDDTMLHALIHLLGNNDNGDCGCGRCCIYVGPPRSATSPVRRIRAGLPSPGPRLILFAISIAVTSAPGTTTTTIFVGVEKPCTQLMWAQLRGCALLPRRQVGCGRGSRSTVALLVLSCDVGHVIVTVAAPNQPFHFLYGHDVNRGGLGWATRIIGEDAVNNDTTKRVRDDQQKTTTNLQWEGCDDVQ
jgi:hypothetical protein